MRDYEKETKNRVEFIKTALKDSGTNGIVYGNSGGKDCTLVGILCKLACENTVGIIMPGASARNYASDTQDAVSAAEQYNIETRTVDLGAVLDAIKTSLEGACALSASAISNLAPRLRMTSLYAIAASENRLVAGTGNRSERYMGYFTKWGDGAFDFNPISDLTVTEIYEFLRHLKAPVEIIEKAPSAGLFEGQTDESEMGVSYDSIDRFLLTGATLSRDEAVISRYHKTSGHKRVLPLVYMELPEN